MKFSLVIAAEGYFHRPWYHSKLSPNHQHHSTASKQL